MYIGLVWPPAAAGKIKRQTIKGEREANAVQGEAISR